jgi:hypothetical protein
MAEHIRGPPEPHVCLIALHPLYSILDVTQECYGSDIHV